MATYHFSAEPIGRSTGRSSTAAAAYRSGTQITDERTGEIHDYRRKKGVLHSELILPGGGTADRAEFWNGIEKHHKRGDAVLVREIEISLPTELTPAQRQELAVSYGRELADRYGVAADVALHAPHTVTDKDLERKPNQYWEIDPETGRRHNGNWHVHVMLSACYVEQDGTLGKKAVELDPIHCKRAKIENFADRERERWCELANTTLELHGHDARIDHRTLAAQGIDREPGIHLGPAATAIERRGGVSDKTANHQAAQREAAELAAAAAAAKVQAEAERAAAAKVQAEAERAAAAAAAKAQAEAVQAQREAAALAAAAAAKVQAEAEAAAAAHQAAEQARAAAQAQTAREALNAQLTAEKEEKENDRIRAKALAALGKASGATDAAISASKSDLRAAKNNVERGFEITKRNERDIAGAAKGAERRVTRNHLESCAPAVRGQLGQADHLFQQLVEYLPRVVRAIAAAAKEVTQQLQKAAAKAQEKPPAPAQTQAKAIPTPQPEKPPAPVLEPALNDADRKLITRLDDAIERAAKGDQKAMDSLPGLLDKLDDAQRDAASAYYRVAPKGFHHGYAERDAKLAREEAAKLDVNRQAAARGVGAVPYPPGLSGQWATDHHSSYETALAKATKELGYHDREPRPEGFWKKKETAAYDAKTAELQSKVSGWEKEIGWRDGALRAASEAREPQDAQHIARAKEIHDREQAPTAAKAEPAKARNEAHKRENSRLQEKIERLFDKPKQRELDQKQRDHGQDYGR